MRVSVSFLAACCCITAVHLANVCHSMAMSNGAIVGVFVTVAVLIRAAMRDWEIFQTTRPQRVVALTAMALYLASCVTPTFLFFEETGGQTSFWDTVIGPPLGLWALLMGATFGWWLPWSANLLLPVGLSCLARRQFAFASIVGLLAFAAALSSCWEEQYRLLFGYYFWQASFAALAVGAAIVGLVFRKRGLAQTKKT
jgi:hypothetical protein